MRSCAPPTARPPTTRRTSPRRVAPAPAGRESPSGWPAARSSTAAPWCGGRDVHAVRRVRISVEGPDLHAGETFLDQADRQLVGAIQEGVQIFVRTFGRARLRQAPVVYLLHRALADIAIAGARVVDEDLLAREPAQQLVDRLAARLAEQIPQRDVGRRVSARLD